MLGCWDRCLSICYFVGVRCMCVLLCVMVLVERLMMMLLKVIVDFLFVGME